VEILYYILIGIVVGALARLLLPGSDPIGMIGTIVVGVIGAVIGGYLAGAVFEETEGVDWIASILVALGLLFVYRKMTYGRGRGRVLSDITPAPAEPATGRAWIKAGGPPKGGPLRVEPVLPLPAHTGCGSSTQY
jgi:uncharacterized membrane protein YeaQ/YmgE (transglycosylase-associated protein family)